METNPLPTVVPFPRRDMPAAGRDAAAGAPPRRSTTPELIAALNREEDRLREAIYGPYRDDLRRQLVEPSRLEKLTIIGALAVLSWAVVIGLFLVSSYLVVTM